MTVNDLLNFDLILGYSVPKFNFNIKGIAAHYFIHYNDLNPYIRIYYGKSMKEIYFKDLK